MGKSVILQMFQDLGVKTWDADFVVHQIYIKNQSGYNALVNEFGVDIVDDNGINRQKLSQLIKNNPKNLEIIENIIHPLIKEHRQNFINENEGEKYIVFDIPLLFETNIQNEFDKIIVVDCPKSLQEQRVLERPNMTMEKFNLILQKQIPNQEKLKKADFIIDTSKSIDECRQRVDQIHKSLID